MKQRLLSAGDTDTERGALDQLAGLTGLGWTASALGFLGTALGYGNWLVARLVADPVSLLYIGGVFFVATLGLDRLTGVDDTETD